MRRTRPSWFGQRVETITARDPAGADYRFAQARMQSGVEVRTGRFYRGGPLCEAVYDGNTGAIIATRVAPSERN